MSIGKKIYDLRIKNGYSQEEFAKSLNVSRQAVSKWEREITMPDLYNLKKIALFFNISIDVLVGQINNDNKRLNLISKLVSMFRADMPILKKIRIIGLRMILFVVGPLLLISYFTYNISEGYPIDLEILSVFFITLFIYIVFGVVMIILEKISK